LRVSSTTVVLVQVKMSRLERPLIWSSHTQHSSGKSSPAVIKCLTIVDRRAPSSFPSGTWKGGPSWGAWPKIPPKGGVSHTARAPRASSPAHGLSGLIFSIREVGWSDRVRSGFQQCSGRWKAPTAVPEDRPAGHRDPVLGRHALAPDPAPLWCHVPICEMGFMPSWVFQVLEPDDWALNPPWQVRLQPEQPEASWYHAEEEDKQSVAVALGSPCRRRNSRLMQGTVV
jgi:hypothetical protein